LCIFQNNQLSREEHVFQEFLRDTKYLLEKLNLPSPICFISYAWETGTDNDHLQSFLLRLETDLGKLGIKTFLDIKRMQR